MIAASLAALAQHGVAARGHGVALLALHAACAGLAYLLFVNLSKRKLGAPLIAAVLFGAHPFVVATLAGDAGVRGLAGAALGLLAGVLLARTPLEPRLLWPSLAAYGASLPLAPGAAAVPFLVAAAAVAYHGLEPSRLVTKRLLPRFAVFLVPLGAWAAWSASTGSGRGFRAVEIDFWSIVFPFATWPGLGDVRGIVLVLFLVALGVGLLRSSPKIGWPMLATGLSLVAAATLRDAWGVGATAYAALAFVALAAAEGIEALFYRFGAAVAAPLAFVVYAALAVQSHVAAGR